MNRVPIISPDLAARRVIMASHLYYMHDSPIMSDQSYDNMVNYVVKHFRELEPARMWQLKSREHIKASGFHIKFTTQSICAAHNWYFKLKGKVPDLNNQCMGSIPKLSPTFGAYYGVNG